MPHGVCLQWNTPLLLTWILANAGQLEEANQKLADANDELSTLNKNLVLARDQALEASSLKSSFVANISHELRTPVTGVMGMNELLMRTELTPHQKDLASSIQEAAKSLHLIVNDILDLSKIEAGKMTLQRLLLNLPEMVRESINMLLPAAQKKGLVLNCLIDPHLEEHASNLSGDPVRVNQVLLNLMGNAVKFTDHGQIDVEATVLKHDESRIY